MKRIFLAVIILSCLAGVTFAQPANCTSPTSVTSPFSKDGAGTFCFVTTCMGANINSWNMTKVEINGVDYTNKYADGVYNGGPWPAPMNGNYYIYYNAAYAWSHFEMTGTCSGATSGPTATPTTGPTTGPTATPTPTGNATNSVKISPASQSGSGAITIEIRANTTVTLGAFGFTVTYPSNMFTFGSITEITSGLNLTTNSGTPGQIKTAGFNATGIAANSDLGLIRIVLNATGTGTANIGLTVDSFADASGNAVACTATGGTVTLGTTQNSVKISPATQTVDSGAVTIEIRANTTVTLGAFGFTITYPSNMFTFGSIAEITSGLNLTTNSATAGQIKTAGFNANGIAANADLGLIRIVLNSTGTGTGNIGLTVDSFADAAGNAVSVTATGGTVTVGGTPVVTPVPTATPTTGPTGGPNTVRINPATQTVDSGAVTIEIRANTTVTLGAFGFTITYPSNMFTFGSIAEITSGLNLTTNSATAGQIKTAGFNANGIAANADLGLIRIVLNSTGTGTGNIGLTVDSFADAAGNAVAVTATGGTVTVGGTPVVTPVPTATPTATPTPGANSVKINPASQTVDSGAVTIEIRGSTTINLGAFGFTITYPSNMFTFGSIAEITSGLNLTTNSATAGQIKTAGFNANGIAANADLGLIRIVLNTTGTAGTGNIGLTVDSFADAAGNAVTCTAAGGTITVNGTVTTPPTPVPTATPTAAPTGQNSVKINPASQTVTQGTVVTLEIRANTTISLGAFGFTVTYPSNMFTFGSIAEITSGLNLTTNSATAGQIKTAGFNANGIAANADLGLIRITLNATAAGTGSIGLTVDSFADAAGNSVTATATGGTVIVSPTATAVPTAVPTATPVATSVPTATPVATAVPTATPVATAVPTATPVATAVPTATPVVTAVPTAVPTATPEALPGIGGAWVVPQTQSVANGASCSVEIHVNTGTKLIAAYGIVATWDAAILGKATAAALASPGFMSAANTNTAGTANVSGFDASGKGPATDFGLFSLTFTAAGRGTATISLQINTFVDENTTDFGTHTTRAGSITVN